MTGTSKYGVGKRVIGRGQEQAWLHLVVRKVLADLACLAYEREREGGAVSPVCGRDTRLIKR